MDYKLEKFWNSEKDNKDKGKFIWTINLKSFEIHLIFLLLVLLYLWTINLKSFEILEDLRKKAFESGWTINLKSFEIIILRIDKQKIFYEL